MEAVLFVISLVLSIGYVYLLHLIISGWDNTEDWAIPKSFSPQTKVTVIVAARNEEAHIEQCIQSILKNDYPSHLTEIIIIDDESEDATKSIIESFPKSKISLLNGDGGKKAAISQGVAKSNGTLILCTDADSVVPQNWISGIASYYEAYKPSVITGLIEYTTDNSTLQKFQYFDSINNMAVTAAGIHYESHYLANGANFAFEKSFFEKNKGYASNIKFASGDDVFLIQQAAKDTNATTAFLKSKQTIVNTQPQEGLTSLMAQRKRWASKSRAYPDKGVLYIQGYVFIFILILALNVFIIPFGSGLSLFTVIFMIFIKWTIDYLHLAKIAAYFPTKKPMKSFFSASLLFIVYILYAGMIALFPSKYRWKGRKAR